MAPNLGGKAEMIMTEEGTRLIRRMNLLDATLLVIGGVIGSGIFMTTGYIAEHIPNPGMVLGVWVLGGLITVCGALSFAELGAMFPSSGGQFVYLREAYGKWAGFLFGWTFFWVIECGGIAALAVGFAEYFGYFFPLLSIQNSLVEFQVAGLPYSLAAGQIVAVLAILLLSAVNYFGIKAGVRVQNAFSFLRLVALAVIIIFGLTVGRKSGVSTVAEFFRGSGFIDLKLIGLALISVFWTYDGWYSVNCTAEEVKNPGKNIPLGLILGTLVVTAVYFLMNVVYLLAIPVEKMKGVARVGELASAQLFGPQASFFITASIAVAIFGCLSATIIYGPRVYYAMAEDGLFFRNMGFVHPRYRVPSKAIAWQAAWSAFLCLTGTFRALYEYVVFALLIFFAATGAAVLVLRRKQPEARRPYKTWGYPFVPLAFIAVCLAIFFNTIASQPFKSFIGLLIMAAGIPAFFYWKQAHKKKLST